jgi:hypothetical protein
LLLDELGRVAKRLGRGLRRIALVENTDYTIGTDEFGSLARYLRAQGLEAVVADPRDFRLVRGRIRAKGLEVDLAYRDCELSEFLEIEEAGHRLTAMREVVAQGRLISGLVWEFDQKSAWELFTDPVHARYFTARQRQLFRRHLPWTRLVRQEVVSDPAGKPVDLIRYIRRHKDRLVLKPNTLFGGEGVVIGAFASQREWERVLERALRGRRRYVVQEAARIRTDTLPELSNGGIRRVERRMVSGFFFSSSGISLVGRFSEQPVVNVSQGGGLIPALWAHD